MFKNLFEDVLRVYNRSTLVNSNVPEEIINTKIILGSSMEDSLPDLIRGLNFGVKSLALDKLTYMGEFIQAQKKYAGTGENCNIVITFIFYPVNKTFWKCIIFGFVNTLIFNS